MAKPEIDRDAAIRAILDAAVSGDRIAAKRAGVDERTLRRWRVRLGSDPELTEAFRLRNQAADRSWKAARRTTLGKLIRAIARKIRDPETTMAELANATKILGELEITQGVLDGSGDDQPGQGPAETSGRGSQAGHPSEPPSIH